MWAVVCTRLAAETIRFPPTCECGFATPSTRLIKELRLFRKPFIAAPKTTGTSFCQPTLTCSGPNRSWPPTTGWPIAKNLIAIVSAWQARRRANVLTLGTGAAAGTSLPIDREYVRARLGFDSLAANSLDASGDRDFVLDFAFALAVTAGHLSGWAEEWILWSTQEFGFIRLPEHFCTCSSMMPQKMNPDVLELIRGRAARVTGNVTSLLVLVQGLPLAYNRDLQEDKQPLFDSFDTVEACLEIAEPIVSQSELDTDAINSRLEAGYLDATTLMEHFIQKSLPQRTAHHAVGTLVRKAIAANIALRDLPLEDFQAVYPDVDRSVYDVLGTAPPSARLKAMVRRRPIRSIIRFSSGQKG